MPQNKKFGTFGGVFTPSLLTILGVIMYMRLSWVVGQTGILGSLGIILVAHVISITTGLSISSVATDKKIKAGGLYYMLSRSLGLPIGGAIGIALLVGTALSISLYIIGFTENFLSIQPISEFLGLEPGIASYRLVGTAVIIILVILAFISTSLAIKTQYIILGAIGLSLVSIFVGFGLHPEFLPKKPAFFMAENSMSIEKVFAIFFPAVTGFTAGVAMSGDLRNPKKNIPVGTMLAIAVGFVVYISLAVMFGFFIDRDILLSDNNIIMNVSWVPQAVVAGIWGATLSSALGGILGGPRILQALAADEVLPKKLSKGYGKNNEPRIALIAVFLIAEGGILIGSLDAIAGIVTMFYLTSYGFINLAYVLEDWASIDFRPSFKISKLFGIIGFLFAFAIMFKLDIISMLAAFVIIGLIYFILSRKQLKLEYGDVWQSVWVSVVRRGLRILDHNNIEDRNWQPNIVLFSGGGNKRPHLLEFGQSLAGKYGFLSNFDLILDDETSVLFPKHKQSIPDFNNDFPGLFTRKQTCSNIYEGIEMILRTYGFSGIEPNTAIIGWGRQSKDPERFVHLIQTINALDYNVLLIDFDKRYKYGNYKQIDIWWRGAGNNGNFALTLAKFMLTSEKWENAKIRLMIVNNEYSKTHYIYRQANEILENIRLSAEVKVVNNEVEKKAFYDIIRTESQKADIVFLGIPEIRPDTKDTFVKKTNELLHEIGTVILIKASSLFKEMNLGINISQQSVISESHNFDLEEKMAHELISVRHEGLNETIRLQSKEIIVLHEKTIATLSFKEFDAFLLILQETKTFADSLLNSTNKELQTIESNKRQDYLEEKQVVFVNKVNKLINQFINKDLPDLQDMMLDVLFDYQKLKQEFFDKYNQQIALTFKKDNLKIRKSDSTEVKLLKYQAALKNKSSKSTVSIVLTKQFKEIYKLLFFELLSNEIENIRIESLRFLFRYTDYTKKIIRALNQLKNAPDGKAKTSKRNEQIIVECQNSYHKLETVTKNIVTEVSRNRKNILIISFNEFLKNTENLDDLFHYRQQLKNNKTAKNIRQITEKRSTVFFSGLEWYSHYIRLKNLLALYKHQCIDEINHHTRNHTNTEAKTIVDSLRKSLFKKAEVFPNSIISVMTEESLNNAFFSNFDSPEQTELNPYKTVKQYTEKHIIKPFSETIETFIDAQEKEDAETKLSKFSKSIEKITDKITITDARDLLVLHQENQGKS